MGVDKSNGVMHLDKNARIDIDWPYEDSKSLYDAIVDATEEFGRKVGAKTAFPLPTWLWPSRNNVTVHSLVSLVKDTFAWGLHPW
jgi:cholesterol oxidase